MRSSEQNETRFTAWLADHHAILRKLSRVYAADVGDEDDLHQEMLVQLWRSLPRFRGQAQVSTWIYRVCLNTALTWRRSRQRREARVVTAQGTEPEAVSPAAGPDEEHQRKERLAALLGAVRALPPTDRSLVVLALDGLSHREIGEIMGMTENHVGVALLRARRKLGETLKGMNNEL